MSEQSQSRRDMLKKTGLGLGLTATAPWVGTSLLIPSRVEAVTPSQNYASLPVLDEVDVLVCGGGAAGIGAGMGAAQQGARTLVIENCSFFGGVISWMVGMEMMATTTATGMVTTATATTATATTHTRRTR